MKLYEIPLRYQVFIDRVDENDGEITEDLASMLASIEDELATKADAYAAMIKRFKYEEEAFRSEIRVLTRKANASAKAQENLRGLLLHAMKSIGLDRIKGKRFSVSRVVNKTPSIAWESNRQIPPAFQKISVSLDKEAAHKILEDGGSLPEGFKITNTEYVRIT